MTNATASSSELAVHDTSDMLGAIAGLPDQLPDGLARADRVHDEVQGAWPTAAGAEGDRPRVLVVCGMGGSGVGGDLLAAVGELNAPVVGIKGYDLPDWLGDEDRVVCVSYSGNTAETLACFDAAIARGAMAAVITTGGSLAERAKAQQVPIVELPAGMQPRAAVGVLFGALAGVAAALGVIDDATALVHEAASGARRVVDQHQRAVDAGEDPPSLVFARQLHDHAIVVYGAADTEAIAWRWKAQVNENSKVPCFANAYPELDHNEIVGWEFARATGARWALVELMPFGVSEALHARFDITRELMADAIDVDLRFEPAGATRAEAAFELIAHGDYLSVQLALLRGIDPTPVERIHALKDRLAGR